MRLITYIGLVLRRIWARKLMLVGSFLGATLVTALLVVLPLYEASVSAVDLLFTFRQAPDETVDLVAVATTTDFTAGFAEVNRAAIAGATSPIAAWYPTTVERTLTREFVVIPLLNPDWLQLAADWRTAGGPESGQDPPYPRPPQEPTQVRFFTTPDIASQIVIDGDPIADQSPLSAESPMLRVVIGEDVARLAGLEVGDTTILRGYTSLPEEFEVVEVSGIGRPVDPTAAIWDQMNPGMIVMVTESTLSAWSGSFATQSADEDPWLRGNRGLGRMQASETFVLHLDRGAVSLDTVAALARGVNGFVSGLARSEGIRAVSRLPGIVEDFDVRTVVFGAPILAMLALIVAGALYFLIYMASLALERESSELALLRMRGASPWQTTGLHLIQSAIIATGAVLLAPLVARAMVSVTGRIPPMSTLTGGESLSVTQGRSIVPFALAGGALTFISMGLAIIPVARRSALELRAMATRPARVSVWQRYHLDVFLVVLAGVILYQLRQQGIVGSTPDSVGLDPFSVAAPALFLFAGALLLLRVLPWLLRGVGWLMTRFRGMTSALPGWHLGRNPIPYGRLALLVWLTTGFGAFALTYASTLDVSYADRAAFTAGSDARIVGDGVAYLDVPEGVGAAQVLRGVGAPRLASRGSELLAVDPATFPSVLTWRDDFGAPTADDAFGLDVLGAAADWGVELPLAVESIRVDGLVVPSSWVQVESSGHADPIRLMVRLVDGKGRFRVHAATTAFTDEGWATAEVLLAGDMARNGPFGPAESLVLQAIWFESDLPTGDVLPRGQILLSDWRAVTSGVSVAIGDAVSGELTGHGEMSVRSVDGGYGADEFFSELPPGQSRPTGSALLESPYYRPGPVTALSFPRRNRAQPVPHLRRDGVPLAFVLDREAATIAGLGVGSRAQFGIDNQVVEGTVTGIVDLIPTTGDPTLDGAMVTRLDTALQWLSANPPWSLSGAIAASTTPQELWMATDDPNGTLREVLAEYPADPELVITANGVSADFSSRPIQVGLVSILFIGTGAGVVLALAGVTGYVLVAVRRRYREMGVLRALGFRRRGVAGTFALEQVVVLGVGALIGVTAGVGLMRLMIPFLQLGEGAAELVPSAIMVIPFGTLGMYLSIVAALLVVSVLWSTRSVSARRLSEVLREVER